MKTIESKPSLRGLSYALRHPETWPAGFEFDYGDCKRCAIGLIFKLWGIQYPIDIYLASVDA